MSSWPSLKTYLDEHGVTLVAASKGRTIEQIKALYDQGIRDFGENRVQEALVKMDQLPSDIRWHFIGRLQHNKVAKVIGRFYLIHSVDSLELAQKMADRKIPQRILLQVNTSGEQTKAGLSAAQWIACFDKVIAYNSLQIEGLMTIAPHTSDRELVRHCFQELKKLQQTLQKKVNGKLLLPILSMGMSQDYQIAVEEGATLVRIGRALFDAVS